MSLKLLVLAEDASIVDYVAMLVAVSDGGWGPGSSGMI